MLSPLQSKLVIVETPATLPETPTHTDGFEFSKDWHTEVLSVDFLCYKLNDLHDSRPAKSKRYLDWLVN